MSESSDVIIRQAALSDIYAIRDLWILMMDYHKDFDHRFTIVPKGPELFLDYCRSILKNPNYMVLVAEIKDTIVGYVISAIFDNPEIFILSRYGFLAEMSVAPDLRSTGIGNKLWTKTAKWFRREGINVVQLNVSFLNDKGIKFWESLGFKPFLHVLWNDLSEAPESREDK